MYDNKIRLSHDVLEKAEQIAAEWGLKNARAAVEAVFRRYSDEYLHGRGRTVETDSMNPALRNGNYHHDAGQSYVNCEALNELDDLLSL
jgi:hypothetical protein